MRISLKLGMVFLCFAVIGSVLFFQPRHQKAREEVVSTIPSLKVSNPPSFEPTKAPANSTRDTTNSKSLPIDSTHPFHLALQKNENLRSLYEVVKTQPEKGGWYYATYINNRCWAVREALKLTNNTDSNAPHGVAVKRESSLNQLRRQCESFLDTELEPSELSRIFDGKANEKDPLLNLAERVRSANLAGDIQKRREVLAEVLNSNSPEFVRDYLIQKTEGGAYFDGVTYKYGASGDVVALNAAVFLAQCQLGFECDSSQFFLINACATQFICAENSENYVRQVLERGNQSKQSFQDVQLLAKKIENAIRTKDFDKFLKP